MSSELIIGRNGVREAIKKGEQIDKILVVQGLMDASIKEILLLARQNKVVVAETSRYKLDEMCTGIGPEGKIANHQGIVALVPAFKYSEMEDIFELAQARSEHPFIILLDSVQDPQNLGAIIRSAEVLGAHGVIIGKRRSATLNSAAYRVSCGAAQYIPIVKVTNISTAIAELKEKGVWIVAADVDGQPLSATNLKGSLAIVVGSEGDGISRLVRENCDLAVKIEMGGQVNSLNAACAASIIMYEKRRQDLV